MTTTLPDLMNRLTFGPPNVGNLETSDASPADGGWVNTSVPVYLDGRPWATALIGAMLYGSPAISDCPSEDIYDEVQRDGWAVRRYRGDQRRLAGPSGADLESLVDNEETDRDDIAEAILEAAHDAADVDYSEPWAAALCEAITVTANDLNRDQDIRSLQRGLRALQGAL